MVDVQSKKTKSTRELAYQILFEFERSHLRVDILESKYLTDIRLDAQNRRFVRQLISGSIRYLSYLDWIIGRLYHGRFSKLLNKTKTILRLAIYEIIYLDNIPGYATVSEYVSLAKKKVNPKQGAMINAVLRNFLKQPLKFDPDKLIVDKGELISIKFSFPSWLVNRWIDQWGIEKTEQLCTAFNDEPDFDIHINPEKISIFQMEELLKEQNISFRKSELFKDVYKIKNIQKLIQQNWLAKGLCSVQDESAHIPVELLDIQNDDIVLDMCAAPGGKFIQILQRKGSFIAIATDIDKSRLKTVKNNMQRLNLENGFLVVADGKHLPFKPIFNKILLDVPCSGLGVIRKHPDIKWRRTAEDIQSFARLQTKLLECAADIIKVAGNIVYSTCTIDPIENEHITENFYRKYKMQYEHINPPESFSHLQKNKHIRTFPDDNQMDGSYCTIFKKI